MGGTSQVRNNTNLDHRDGYRFLVMRLSAWLKLDSRLRGNDERCRLFRFARGAGSYGYPKVVIAKERSDCGNLMGRDHHVGCRLLVMTLLEIRDRHASLEMTTVRATSGPESGSQDKTPAPEALSFCYQGITCASSTGCVFL